MKLVTVVVISLLILVSCVHAGSEVPTYHTDYDFLLTSPGAMKLGLYGYVNPAVLTYVDRPDLMFTWSDEGGKVSDFDRWGLFAAVPRLGFGVISEENSLGSVSDYRLSLAFGGRKESFGVGYGWATGDTETFRRSNVVTVGSLTRPIPELSVGVSGIFATSGSAKEGVVDLALRPFGNEILALFGDYALKDHERAQDGHWSLGAAFEPLPGVRLAIRYLDTEAFNAGISFSLGHFGLTSQAHYDENQEHRYNTYGVRAGAIDRNVFRTFANRRKKYIQFDLVGPVKYRRYRMFDKSNTLMGIISAIDGAKKDDTVAGIAINTSGMRINRELAWELREKLNDFRSSGKHIVVFIDNAGIDTYHFASVADKIVIDPTGAITLEGFRLGRFYLKGTLEKLGLGFDEWRFFKYKSAYEILSRDEMSEGDKEQRQALVDDYYKLAKGEICEARDMDPAEFDRLVNEEILFLPEEALELGLVDTLGRWEAVKKTVERIESKPKAMAGPGSIAKYQLPTDDYWGERPKVALIYALGVCAMDQGIKARSLSKIIEGAANDRSIKAVVFRVDSPGGDGTASDLVAEALKECSEKKPVIVSQGYVAASGGYWLSMYADTIVAAPITITGSIGVIGGWVYNKGLKDKLGMSTDLVKVGEHADLGFGITLPLLGQVPDRNLSVDERAKIEHAIKTFYKQFVERVASGRSREYDEIEPIAQGRVWSGYDGTEIGLVDVLGGLETAIMIAKEKAGIPEEEDIQIIEMPKPALFNPQMFTPKLFGIQHRDNELNRLVEFLKFRLEHNGRPMPILPMEYIEATTELD